MAGSTKCSVSGDCTSSLILLSFILWPRQITLQVLAVLTVGPCFNTFAFLYLLTVFGQVERVKFDKNFSLTQYSKFQVRTVYNGNRFVHLLRGDFCAYSAAYILSATCRLVIS